MATITYNTDRENITHVYTTTNGGVDFSANLVGTAFDYFLDSPTADDAIYFGSSGNSVTSPAGVELDVNTALVGVDVVLIWEYLTIYDGWQPIKGLDDATVNFTATGANKMAYFPWQEFRWTASVNGVALWNWTRCRLVSFSSVAEGGANTSDTPQFGFGNVHLNDYTEGSPADMDDIYDYMSVNYPDCGIEPLDAGHKIWTFYHAGIDTRNDGYLKLANNVLYLANGSGISQSYRFDKLLDGTKIGDDKFYEGSVIYLAGYRGAPWLTVSASTKLYGTQFKAGTYVATIAGNVRSYTGAAFTALANGEYIGINVSLAGTGYWSGASLVMRNCFFKSSFNVTFPFDSASILANVHLYGTTLSAGMIGIYSGAGTGDLTGLNWHLDSGRLFRATSLGTGTYIFNFLNPSPAFPNIGDSPVDYMYPNAAQDEKDWHIYEKYSLDLKTVDATGTEIAGATVTITDKNGDAVTGSPFTTDANGDITQAKCIKSHGYWDTERKKDEFNPYTVTITATGYSPRTVKYTMDRKREEIEALGKVKDLNFSKHIKIFTQ